MGLINDDFLPDSTFKNYENINCQKYMNYAHIIYIADKENRIPSLSITIRTSDGISLKFVQLMYYKVIHFSVKLFKKSLE